MTDCGEIIYSINDADEICFVNKEYDDFAAANADCKVTSSAVLNRPLWDFIVDPPTRALYRDILKRVRDGHPIRYDFRCDAPTWRRLLQMEIICGNNRTVEFHVRTKIEEKRQIQSLLDNNAARSDELLCVCGWCKKVEVGDSWMEVEDAIAKLRLFENPLIPQITHGICEPCYEKMTRELTKS